MRLSRPEILGAFREHKVRCTPQRFTILDYLNRNPKHPTAEEIYTAINRTDPRASLATVYKSLHALASAGLIREVAVEGNAVRFESNMARHHHFVCDRCGHVEDVEWYDVPRPRAGSLGKRIVRECEVIFRGLCTKCAARHASR